MIQVPECQNHTVAYWHLACGGPLCIFCHLIFYLFIVGSILWGSKDGEIVEKRWGNDLLLEMKVNSSTIKVNPIHPLGIVNVRTTFHGNLSSSCESISLLPEGVTHECLYKCLYPSHSFWTLYPMMVHLSASRVVDYPVNPQADTILLREMLLLWLKIPLHIYILSFLLPLSWIWLYRRGGPLQ